MHWFSYIFLNCLHKSFKSELAAPHNTSVPHTLDTTIGHNAGLKTYSKSLYWHFYSWVSQPDKPRGHPPTCRILILLQLPQSMERYKDAHYHSWFQDIFCVCLNVFCIFIFLSSNPRGQSYSFHFLWTFAFIVISQHCKHQDAQALHIVKQRCSSVP